MTGVSREKRGVCDAAASPPHHTYPIPLIVGRHSEGAKRLRNLVIYLLFDFFDGGLDKRGAALISNQRP